MGQSQAVVLLQAYMEDHLRNRDRLAKEWQALCAYQAEPNTCATAQGEGNIKKNRHPDFLPCKWVSHGPDWPSPLLGAIGGCGEAARLLVQDGWQRPGIRRPFGASVQMTMPESS